MAARPRVPACGRVTAMDRVPTEVRFFNHIAGCGVLGYKCSAPPARFFVPSTRSAEPGIRNQERSTTSGFDARGTPSLTSFHAAPPKRLLGRARCLPVVG